MNRPRIATVLSARAWEARLVDAARRDPTVRIVRRAYEPQDLERARPVDIVVVGSETSWISSSRIRSIRRRGTRVLGVYPAGDRPGRDLLTRGGADATVPDTTTPEDLLRAASMAATQQVPPAGRGRLIAVAGPRGAPGRTEVAASLARALSTEKRTAIVDLDTEAPDIAVRFRFEPGPDLREIADAIRTHDRLLSQRVPGSGDLTVVAGTHPPRTASAVPGIAEIMEFVLASFDMVVADTGPHRTGDRTLAVSDAIVLVCDARPSSLIRAARLVHSWEGPMPYLVLNRTTRTGTDEAVRAARRALGLEPHTLIPEVESRKGAEAPMLTENLHQLASDLSGELHSP